MGFYLSPITCLTYHLLLLKNEYISKLKDNMAKGIRTAIEKGKDGQKTDEENNPERPVD